MANTVSILSYANTFGDWVVNTNKLANEINTLGSGNYTKDTGILVLNGVGTGLQVSNNALFTSNVNITGVGQALQVTNDAIISGNLYANQIITLGGITANSVTINTINITSTANVGGDLGVTGNTYIDGNLIVTGNTNLTIENVSMDEIVAGNLVVNGTISGNGVTLLQSDILSAALALSVALG
jgi:cytoskeletal protein CcmA (bactofilin family)